MHTGVGFSVEDLEAEHERLVGLGVGFSMAPTRQPWAGFMALMADKPRAETPSHRDGLTELQ